MASMARLRSSGSRPCAAATTEWRVSGNASPCGLGAKGTLFSRSAGASLVAKPPDDKPHKRGCKSGSGMRLWRCAEDEFFFFTKWQAQHQVAFVRQALGPHIFKHVQVVVEVHGMCLGGPGGNVKNE